MAEFCEECFKRLIPDWDITQISKERDLCEGCGEWKPVVVYAEPKNKEVSMRSGNNLVSFIINFPAGVPDRNGVIYTREAVARALKSMPDMLPIIDSGNDGKERVIGATTSKPYAVQWDEASGVYRFTVDGIIFKSGTSCIVNAANNAGEVTDFTIIQVGISE